MFNFKNIIRKTKPTTLDSVRGWRRSLVKDGKVRVTCTISVVVEETDKMIATLRLTGPEFDQRFTVMRGNTIMLDIPFEVRLG